MGFQLIQSEQISLQCEREWFHFGCVGLTEGPGDNTTWYCPDCRVKPEFSEKGHGRTRQKKK
jgi:hypothetical protein